MPRNYYVNGQCMVSVLGNSPTLGNGFEQQELGLTDTHGVVTIALNYIHQDIHTDDFGPFVPVETLWELATAEINMTLVHFDPAILTACLNSSAAGGSGGFGTMAGAGTPMGNGTPADSNDPANKYIQLSLQSNDDTKTWIFNTAYLAQVPVVWPISAERSRVQCKWRAIPYAPPGQSSRGTVVWSYG